MQRKKQVAVLEPYNLNPEIFVYYELDFNKETITPGFRLKFKKRQGVFQFRFWAHNSKIDKTWIDCIDTNTGEFRAFPIEDLKSIVKLKKSRKKPVAK